MTAIDPGGPAVHAQVARDLTARIHAARLDGCGTVSGMWGWWVRPGGCLPAVRELAEFYGVSRHMIRRALRELRDNGIVSAEPGPRNWVPREYWLSLPGEGE